MKKIQEEPIFFVTPNQELRFLCYRDKKGKEQQIHCEKDLARIKKIHKKYPELKIWVFDASSIKKIEGGFSINEVETYVSKSFDETKRFLSELSNKKCLVIQRSGS